MIKLSDAFKAICKYNPNYYLGCNLISLPSLVKKLKSNPLPTLVTIYFTDNQYQNNLNIIKRLKQELGSARAKNQKLLVSAIIDLLDFIKSDNRNLKERPKYQAHLIKGKIRRKYQTKNDLITHALNLALANNISFGKVMHSLKYQYQHNHHANVVGKITGSSQAIYNLFCSGFMTDDDISYDIKSSKRNADRLLHPNERYASKIYPIRPIIRLYNIYDDVQEYYESHLDILKRRLKAPKLDSNQMISPFKDTNAKDFMKWSKLYYKFIGVPVLYPNGFRHVKSLLSSWQTYPLRPQIQFIGQSHVKPRSLVFGRYKPKVVVSTIDYLKWKYNWNNFKYNPKLKRYLKKVHHQLRYWTKKELINQNVSLELQNKRNQKRLKLRTISLGLIYKRQGIKVPKKVKYLVQKYVVKYGNQISNPFK